MKTKNDSMRGLKSVGIGFGAVLVALTFAAGIASAGSFEWVTVDGNGIPNGGQCITLRLGSEVIGAYNPSSYWNATLNWSLASIGTWHSMTTYPALNGRLGFRFNVTDTPSDPDTLTIRAYDTSPPSGPHDWTCTG